MSKASSPPSSRHGYGEDASTWQLLRSDPPAAALQWVEDAVGVAAASVEPLRGGLSSAMHKVSFAAPTAQPIVLRRYVRLPLEPQLAAFEAAALRLTEPLTVPTPRLIAVDTDGDVTGVPMVLMSFVAGRVEWDPAPNFVDGWIGQLAEQLPIVHQAVVAQDSGIRTFERYEQRSYEPPPWASSTTLWERAAAVFETAREIEPRVFIHRDYHPGNVLWKGQRLSGIVDWQSASIGPASIDVGHCRQNLRDVHGESVAVAFTKRWERLTGDGYDPWADVITIIGMLDELRAEVPDHPETYEATLASALAELGAG